MPIFAVVSATNDFGTAGLTGPEDCRNTPSRVLTIGARSDQLRQYRKSSLQGDR
jgi:hypothetical protein